jgi:hypothetical protein
MRQRPSRVPRDPNISSELRHYLDDLERKIPPANMTATAAPGVTDDGDAGWRIGSRWYDLTNDAEYVCLDLTVGVAVWKKTTP